MLVHLLIDKVAVGVPRPEAILGLRSRWHRPSSLPTALFVVALEMYLTPQVLHEAEFWKVQIIGQDAWIKLASRSGPSKPPCVTQRSVRFAVIFLFYFYFLYPLYYTTYNTAQAASRLWRYPLHRQGRINVDRARWLRDIVVTQAQLRYCLQSFVYPHGPHFIERVYPYKGQLYI